VATMADLAGVFGNSEAQMQIVRRYLKKLAAEGLVEIDRSGGLPKYRVINNGTNCA
jgi:hypothetical protein